MKYLLCQPDTHNGFASLTNGTLTYFSVECPHYQSLPCASTHGDKKALRALAAKLLASTPSPAAGSGSAVSAAVSSAETLVHVEDMVALPGPFHTQHVCFGIANYSLYEANLCFVGSTLGGLLAVVVLPGRELIYAAARDPESVRMARQRTQTTTTTTIPITVSTNDGAMAVPEAEKQGVLPADVMSSGGPSTITWVRNKPLVLVGYSHGLVEWYEVSVSASQRARWRSAAASKNHTAGSTSTGASTTMPAASFAHFMSNPSLFRVQQVSCDGANAGGGVEVRLRARHQIALPSTYRGSPHSVLLTSDYFPSSSDVAVGGEGGVYIFSSTQLGSPLCTLSTLGCHFLYCHPFLPFIGALIYGQDSSIGAWARRRAGVEYDEAADHTSPLTSVVNEQAEKERMQDFIQQQHEHEQQQQEEDEVGRRREARDEAVYKEMEGSGASCCCTFCLIGYHSAAEQQSRQQEEDEEERLCTCETKAEEGERQRQQLTSTKHSTTARLRLLCHYALLAKTPRYDAFYSFSWKFSSALELVVSNVEEGKVSVLRLAPHTAQDAEHSHGESAEKNIINNNNSSSGAEHAAHVDAEEVYRVVHEHRLRLPLHSLINVEYISAATATLEATSESNASHTESNPVASKYGAPHGSSHHTASSKKNTTMTMTTMTTSRFTSAGRFSFLRTRPMPPSYVSAAVPQVRTIMLKEDQLAAEVLQPSHLSPVHARRGTSRSHKSAHEGKNKRKNKDKKKKQQQHSAHHSHHHHNNNNNGGATTTTTNTSNTSALPTPEELHLLQQQQYQRSMRTTIGRRIAEGLESVPEVADYRRKLREIAQRQQQHHRQPPVRTLEREAAEAELRTRLHIGPGPFTNLLGMNSAGELECTTVEPNVCATWHEEGSVFVSLGATVCSADLIRIQGIEHVMKQRLESGFGLSAEANVRALRQVSGEEHEDMALLFAYIAMLERTRMIGPIGPVPSVLQLFTHHSRSAGGQEEEGDDREGAGTLDRLQHGVRRGLLLRVLGWSLTGSTSQQEQAQQAAEDTAEQQQTQQQAAEDTASTPDATSINAQALLDSFLRADTSKVISCSPIERAVAMLVLHAHYSLAATLLEHYAARTPVYLSLARLLRRPGDALGVLRTSSAEVRAVFLASLSPWLLAVVLHLYSDLREATVCKQRLYTQPQLSLWDRLAIALLLEPSAEALVHAMQNQLALHCSLLQALLLTHGISVASIPQMQEVVDRTGDFQLGACLYARVGIAEAWQPGERKDNNNNNNDNDNVHAGEMAGAQDAHTCATTRLPEEEDDDTHECPYASPVWPFADTSLEVCEPTDALPLVQRDNFLADCILPSATRTQAAARPATQATSAAKNAAHEQDESGAEAETSETLKEWWWQWVAAYRTFLDNEQAFVKRTTFDVALQRLRELSGRQTLTHETVNTITMPPHAGAHEAGSVQGYKATDRCAGYPQGHSACTHSSISQADSCPPTLLQHIASVTAVRCAICLQPVLLQKDDVPSALAWCMTCQHGGHARHLQDWFARHRRCPVEGCSCHCDEDANFY